jgi:quercetin dioxygenase-like cupin family protein
MKIYRFNRETGKDIDRYNSSGFTLTRVAHLLEETMIQCAYLEPGGLIGYHQATVPQLFLVVQGEGWVRGQALERTRIQAGQGAYWEEGEWHEAGTETGMTAIIFESVRFDLLEWVSAE